MRVRTKNSLSRRSFLSTLGSAAAMATMRRAEAAPPKRPNVVLFIVDDMGWMDCGVYGSRYYETPNIDRLAKRSMRFTNAYSAAPLCTATRASLMTGKYPGRLHITGASGHVLTKPGPLMPKSGPPHQALLMPRCQGFLPLEEYTLGEALNDAGYQTAFVGKWHLGHDPKYWPEHQGFDRNIGGGRWPGPPSYFSPFHIDNLPNGDPDDYIADRLTDEALAFIDQAKDAPFFLNFWQYAVHAPYQSKDDYRAYFETKQDPRGAQDNAVMAGMIKSMDESLGRLLDKLEALSLMDDTIILFSSDNGGNMYDRTARDGTNLGAWAPEGRTPTNNAPLRGGKGSVYEGGIRVPAMVYWPGVNDTEAVSDQVITSPDFYPTLLDMLGIKPQPGQTFDGISIAPALQGQRLDRDTIFGHFPHTVPAVPCQAASWVRQGDWKLIRFYVLDENFPNRIELYNLNEDIAELHNRAGTEAERARQLEALLDQHLAETAALVPKKNPNYNPNAAHEIDGWKPSGHCWLERGRGTLVLNSIGGDPYLMHHGLAKTTGELTFRFRMRANCKGAGQVFWATHQAQHFGPERRLGFQPKHDNTWHEYTVPFTCDGELRAIRIDPATAAGRIEFDWIHLCRSNGAVLKAWEFDE